MEFPTFGTLSESFFRERLFMYILINWEMENIELGLLLMVVGMVTVFVILLIVIWLSQLLISIVNKVAPEEAPKKKVAATGASTDAGAMDAIMAAVDILTAGKGQVIKVEKLQ